ncbi:MAG TPA: DUF4190 domain-containing protein [Actinomycetota bacterium]|jgi:hypothetical protein|nr:DUF4190 domain-containing protein [Actinomycetota bacterium]
MTTCPHCGEAIDDGVATCPHCGREIAATVSTPPIAGEEARPLAVPDVPPVMPVQPPPRPASAGGPAIAALVLGIVAVLLSFTVVFGFLLGALAIIFGGIALSRARTPRGGSKGMGIAGLVLGIVGIAFAVLMIVFLVSLGGLVNDSSTNVRYCIDHPHAPSCRDPFLP